MQPQNQIWIYHWTVQYNKTKYMAMRQDQMLQEVTICKDW
jgi:hypothetical protein